MAPYDADDPIDLFIIIVQHFIIVPKNADRTIVSGVFVFPKHVMVARGYLRVCEGQPGRVTIGVYPPHAEPARCNSRATQRWQLPFYVDLESALAGERAERVQMMFR